MGESGTRVKMDGVRKLGFRYFISLSRVPDDLLIFIVDTAVVQFSISKLRCITGFQVFLLYNQDGCFDCEILRCCACGGDTGVREEFLFPWWRGGEAYWRTEGVF